MVYMEKWSIKSIWKSQKQSQDLDLALLSLFTCELATKMQKLDRFTELNAFQRIFGQS